MPPRRAVDGGPGRRNTGLEERASRVLRGVGVREGQTVLDFGCGEGTYAIPAARLVGNEGLVYALDQDRAKLAELRGKSEAARLENIRIVRVIDRASIPLADESVDLILLYDVLHSWYHPHSQQREDILHALYRVLRPEGLLSFYPGDPEVFQHRTELAAIHREIARAHFCLQSTHAETLIHEGKVVAGHLFSFAKTCN